MPYDEAPLQVYIGASFLKSALKLSSKKNSPHASLLSDLRAFLQSWKSFEDASKSGILLHASDFETKMIRKVRLPNSALRLGKSGGYRLILFLNKENEEAGVVWMYSKKDKANLTGDELKKKVSLYEESKELFNCRRDDL